MVNLEELRRVDLNQVDRSSLVDIRDVVIDEKLSREERIMEFIRQMKNPYLFRCGDMVVQSVFVEDDVTLTERLAQYFRMA